MSKLIALWLLVILPRTALGAIDPDALGKLKKGEASQEVIQTLGKPTSEDHNPDGRFVYVYQYQSAKDPSDKGYATLLFGKDQKLLKLQAYKETGTGK